MATTSQNTMNEFRFITHENKRQSSTIVRAHVMERYHREQRVYQNESENKGFQKSQNGHANLKVQLVGRGKILRWGSDTGKLERGSRVGKGAPDRTIKSGEPPRKNESIRKPDRLRGVRGPRSSSSSTTSKKVEEDLNLVAIDFIKRLQAQGEVRSLMPNHELERGGQRLIQVLGDCKLKPNSQFCHIACTIRLTGLESDYGSLDIEQGRTSPRHQFWIPFAFSDSSTFHACLSKSIAHAAADCGGVLLRPDILKHTGLAIQHLTKALARKDMTPTNQLIVATISLIGAEVRAFDIR